VTTRGPSVERHAGHSHRRRVSEFQGQLRGGGDAAHSEWANVRSRCQGRRVSFRVIDWPARIGYQRVVRRGPLVEVAGLTGTHPDGTVEFPGDPYRQALRCLQRIEELLASVGAEKRHVVRTRMILGDVSHWQEVGKAHGEFRRGRAARHNADRWDAGRRSIPCRDRDHSVAGRRMTPRAVSSRRTRPSCAPIARGKIVTLTVCGSRSARIASRIATLDTCGCRQLSMLTYTTGLDCGVEA